MKKIAIQFGVLNTVITVLYVLGIYIVDENLYTSRTGVVVDHQVLLYQILTQALGVCMLVAAAVEDLLMVGLEHQVVLVEV